MTSPRVYLAGPDVFLPQPTAFAARKKALCSAYGFEGVFPLDAEIDGQGISKHELALRISRANEALIRSCQLLIAHVTPFRGPSCDVGTAYEMGFARALGLRVFAYSNVADDFTARSSRSAGARPRADGSLEDRDQMQIETFGLADNLMLIGAVEDSGGKLVAISAGKDQLYTQLAAFEACLAEARRMGGVPQLG